MSRTGNLPIKIPEKVTVEVDKNNVVTIKGPLGELTQKVSPEIKVKIGDDDVVVERPSDEIRHKAQHGLYRSLINNMIIGVSQGYTIQQELVGVGYRAEVKGQLLEMSLGFSHDVVIEMPPEIKVEAKTERRANPIITLKSADKQLLGHIASKIRSLRLPEPYKGKGIKFVGEEIKRKAGKSASV